MRSILYTALCLLSLAILTNGSALPNPSPAIVARSPVPSGALAARAPEPSHTYKRAPRVKRKQTPLTPEEELSLYLCPFGASVCPITSDSTALGMSPATMSKTIMKWNQEGFECADFENDLTDCGGCGSLDARHDCTTIPNALGLSCVQGSCRVHSCKPGHRLADDGKTCVRS